MNEDIIKGKWAQLKGKTKEKWGELTNDDLDIMFYRGNSFRYCGRSDSNLPS